MFTNCHLALVFLLFITATVSTGAVPEWSDVYTVKGVLHLPYAEIKEPFEAWYDGPSGNSRIDFYDGISKTYLLSGPTEYGIRLKISPYTSDEVLNQITCFKLEGDNFYAVEPQSVLPDLTGFELADTEKVDDKNIEKWVLTTTIGEKKNVYTIWLHYHEDGKAIPVKYDLLGYNTLLGSHYDHYYLTYHSFRSNNISSDAFKVNIDECRNYLQSDNKHVHSFNPMAEFIRPERTDHVDSRFNDFIDHHGKKYNDINEHSLRKEIFRQNVRFIESHNRKNKGFNLAVNHLADKTDNELKLLRGRISGKGDNGTQPFPYKNIERESIPDQHDWRLYGAVTPVKDQAVCGSCWAFGTVGHLEGKLFLHTGQKNLVRLSEQALVDCSWGYGNNGCDGGLESYSYKWILKHGGIPTYADYGNYLGENGLCHADKLEKKAAITGYIFVTQNDVDALRVAIFKEGPINVAIDASQKTFSFYSNGVYYDGNCGNTEDDLDHAVLAVGYGTLNGQDYWLIKNSWSTYWGNDGYILMAAKNNNCGVMTEATYVTMT